MNVHTYDEQYYDDSMRIIRAFLPDARAVTVLSRDDAVAKLYGRPSIDLVAAARRRRDITAAINIASKGRKGN